MAFTSTGRDIAVQSNPATGKLRRVWDTTGSNKGNPRFDDTSAHTVYLAVFCRRGQYWADAAGSFGSLVYTLISDPKATPKSFVSFATDGLARLVTAGLISAPRAYATRTFDTLDALVEYQTPGGAAQAIRPVLPTI